MRSSLRLGLFVAAVGLTMVAGCAAPSEDEDLGSSADELRGKHRWGKHGRGGKKQVAHPEGNYFVDVRANGPGCPEGTWDVAVSEDGETFTMTWSAYEVHVEPGQAFDVKTCALDIELGTNEGVAYSIAAFHYQGYVVLDKEGMSAEQQARYNFRTVGDKSQDRSFAGPFDDSYLFTDEIGGPRRRWSNCQRNESLRINTALKLKNDEEKTGSGYMNAQSADGQKLALTWKLAHRRCDRPGGGPGGGFGHRDR